MRPQPALAILLAVLMAGTSISGCLGSDGSSDATANDLVIANEDGLLAGEWQKVTLTAKNDLSVYIPYFVQDPGSNRAQNGTVLDLKDGESLTVNW